MPDVIAQVTIQAGRVTYPPGSVVAIDNPDEARRLVESGDAEWASDVTPAATGDPQDVGGGGESDVDEEYSDEIPEDFPARKELLAAGIRTLTAVREIKDFDQIRGIGQAKEDAIVAYLEELDDADVEEDFGDEDE